ncbi:MAG: SGNH/GDSL hydrolase family protein [Armatimonadetes bacterium]|nr:SGNH/GDSL hydrolase family protein [Armatimonadota bacterium]
MDTQTPLTRREFVAGPAVVGAALAVCAACPADAAVAPLPAFAPGTRVLFQGDSITDGNRGRSADPNHILGHGYCFIIAAKHGAAFPERKLDFADRGISGNTVLDLQGRWQKDTLDLKPDLLSILIGVNDEGKGIALDVYEQTYDKLLADTLAANPKVRFVLGEPFGSRTALSARRAIVARLAEKYKAALVPFQAAFDKACERAPLDHWIWDGVHPTYSGHQIMADCWEDAVRRQWP